MSKQFYFRGSVLLMICFALFAGCKKKRNPLPPLVTITSPLPTNGNTICKTVNIDVTVQPALGRNVTKVEFYVDGLMLEGKTVTQAPYSCVWTGTDKFGQTRQIIAKAYDNEDEVSSDTVNVILWNGTEKKSMPTSRYSFTTEVVNGKIYVIGGYDASHNVLEEYDPAADTWTRRASPHTGHAAHMSCVIGNKIYVFGGDKGMGWIHDAEMYDPATDTWTNKSPIPFSDSIGTAAGGCVAYGGKAYLFGGMSTNTSYTSVGEYDPIMDTWSMKSEKHIFFPASVVLGSEIYVFGGCTSKSFGGCANPSEKVETYDPVAGVFSPKADMVYKHSGHAACVANGKIYAFGGVPNGDNTGMEVYDPAVGSWKALAPMPQGNINFGCCEVNGKIYIIGSQKVYEYTPE